VRLLISSLAPPNSVSRSIRRSKLIVSVRNYISPLVDRKAGRSHALTDNFDDDYNYDIGDVVKVSRN